MPDSPKMYITCDGEMNFRIELRSYVMKTSPHRLEPRTRTIDIRGRDVFRKLFTELGAESEVIDNALDEIDSLARIYFNAGIVPTDLIVSNLYPNCMTLLYKIGGTGD
jgi:hypothetical protein